MLQKSNLDTHSLSSQESNLTLLSNSIECITCHIFSNCLFAMGTYKFLLLLVDCALAFKWRCFDSNRILQKLINGPLFNKIVG